MKKAIFTIFLIFIFTQIKAQSFSGTGGNIPDDGTSIRFPVTVSGLPASLDSTFGVISVCLNIVHPYISDLSIWLVAPDSTYIELTSGNGGSGNNYWNTCLIDTVPVFIVNGAAPFTGEYRPESPISNVNNGQDPNAVWQLYIEDIYPFADAGILLNWTITFGNNPPQGLALQSSNLPIIKINTLGQIIPDDPKVTVQMQIIDNGIGIRNYLTDTPTVYNGLIGIEIRGSSSQMFPKKSFGFETLDSAGNETDTSFFGMPSESDWILSANYTDKTFMRNVMTYDLSRRMGHYATRTQYCELVLNGQYQGIYVFGEKIKRDPGRVDIAKMTPADTSGDDLTGGYLLKVDKTTGGAGGGWNSNFPPASGGPIPLIQFEYPDVDDILPVQAQYIEQYCDSFEFALNGINFTNPLTGYRRFIDLTTWLDYFLLTELSKNVDGYRISSFFHKAKDSDGGLLRMGPVWDYDIAWGNADYYGGDVVSGYVYQIIDPGAGQQKPFWYNRMMQDPFFVNALRCRWEDLRDSILSTPVLHAWIDSVGQVLDESQNRNFTMWPILGVYVWPNPSPIPSDYSGVKQELKDWITGRSSWLDINLPGNCSLNGLDQGLPVTNVKAYPNPANDETWILLPEYYTGKVTISVQNTLGQIKDVREDIIEDGKLKINLDLYSSGVLICELEIGEKKFRTIVVKK